MLPDDALPLFESYGGSFTPRFTFFAGTLFRPEVDRSAPVDPVRQDTVELVKKMN